MSDTLYMTWHAMDSCVHARLFQDGATLVKSDPEVAALFEKYNRVRRPLEEVIRALNDKKFFPRDYWRDRPELEVRAALGFVASGRRRHGSPGSRSA